MNKVPVLVIAFNRPEIVAETMKAVQVYQPDHLYLACDGPREGKIGEKEKVKQTQMVMQQAVNWPCEVNTLFREQNVGVGPGVVGAINWMFEKEEWGVILEDDIVVSQDFFKLCEELLPRYNDNDRIQQIEAQFYGPQGGNANTYVFNKTPHTWGWATWRRAWTKYMDVRMSKWPSFNPISMMKDHGVFKTLMMCHYWRGMFKSLRTLDIPVEWDWCWQFAGVTNNLLSISPLTNLSINIGLTTDGVHYSVGDFNRYEHMVLGHYDFPLVHPKEIESNKELLNIDKKEFFRVRMIGAKEKIQKKLNFKK